MNAKILIFKFALHILSFAPNILEFENTLLCLLSSPYICGEDFPTTVVLHFPVTILLEPEITESKLNQTVPEIILNLNSSVVSRGRTLDIDLPEISMNNGPFRLVCVIIYKIKKTDTCLYLQSFLHHCGDQQQ